MRAHLDVFNDACFLIFDNLLLEINQVRCCHIGDQLRILHGSHAGEIVQVDRSPEGSFYLQGPDFKECIMTGLEVHAE